jgi:hypothetical protein
MGVGDIDGYGWCLLLLLFLTTTTINRKRKRNWIFFLFFPLRTTLMEKRKNITQREPGEENCSVSQRFLLTEWEKLWKKHLVCWDLSPILDSIMFFATKNTYVINMCSSVFLKTTFLRINRRKLAKAGSDDRNAQTPVSSQTLNGPSHET